MGLNLWARKELHSLGLEKQIISCISAYNNIFNDMEITLTDTI